MRDMKLSHLEVSDEKERAEKLADILSDGVCAHLKKQGVLGKKPGQKAPLAVLVRRMPGIAPADVEN